MAKILVAEDDPALAAFLAQALTKQGHAVTKVDDGMGALAALAADRFDLLLADIVIPEPDGVALALKASRDYPAMKIMLMTGYDAERQRAHNLDALVDGVVMKPFNLDEICGAVSTLLKKN
ncbi:MAG TPA: response regulator [Stellaceae bacterium]|jgi:DNA-binding response OmpR family regulator